MDADARRKALFRAKLNAQKKDKRINSPLVRYNELDQPVCRICDIVLKSEVYWDTHQSSRKHHEAINHLKASTAGRSGVNIKTEAPAELDLKSQKRKTETFTDVPKPQSSSMLPPDFFDNSTKRLKTGKDSVKFVEPDRSNEVAGYGIQSMQLSNVVNETDGLSSANIAQSKGMEEASGHSQKSNPDTASEMNQVKGALPEGFFDDKEADLRARGIKLVKPDVKDEYKEFEKLIQEDLQEVDDRLEEEEIDAAEMIEEAETLEQRGYRERVQMLRMKKMELKTARSAKHDRPYTPEIRPKESSLDESLSDDDDDSDSNYAVDWRAQHL